MNRPWFPAAIALAALAAGCAPAERAAQPERRGSILPKGSPTTFLVPRSIGTPAGARERPQIAHVKTVDLDRDGLLDIIACDMLGNQVVWIRQAPRGTFTETAIGATVGAPAHAEPVDIDADGDVDILVASLGVLFPSNARIGAVVVLENDGRGRFSHRVLASDIARVSDVQRGGSRRRRRSRPGRRPVRVRSGRDAVDAKPGRLAVRQRGPAESLGPDQRGDRRSRSRR